MKTFLVPVDFSAVSEEILDTAAGFARAFQGKVVLIHAIAPPIITGEYALPVEAIQDAMVAGEQAAHSKLKSYAKRLTEGGIANDLVVRHSSPVAAILDEAEAVRADFIIMGSHGHGKLYDLLVGSTASGVLKGATCGVIVMPPEDKNG